MTLETKFLKTYFSMNNDCVISDDPETFAQIHLDNPFGQRIKGEKDCKTCKGEGYIKCRSGKHERGCKTCMMKMRIEKSVVLIDENGNEIRKIIHPIYGCKECKGSGLLPVKNPNNKDKQKSLNLINICRCTMDLPQRAFSKSNTL